MIIRQQEPKVLETPLDRVDSFLTPVGQFYVRSHTVAPKLELATYRVQIDGAVRRPFSLTYEELRAIPAETRAALLECAGTRATNQIEAWMPRVELAAVPRQDCSAE